MKSLISFLLVFAMVFTLCGCGSKEPATSEGPEQDTTQATTASETQGQEEISYTGPVSAITEESLTLAAEDGELSFTLTESTLYYRQFGRGDFRPDGMGQPQEGMEAPPQMPSDGQQGQQPEGSEPPAMPSDGQQGQQPEGTPPAMPSDGQQGQQPQGGEPPAMPSDGQQGQQPEGTPPAMPSEGTQNDGGTGESSDSTSGGFTPGNGNQGGMPGGNGNQGGMPGEIGTPPTGTDMNPGGMAMEPQTISREEIQVGDTVTVLVGEGNTALSVTVEGDKGSPDGEMGFPGGGEPGGMGIPGSMGPGGMSSGVESYDALTELSSDTTLRDQELRSTGKDENAVHVLEGAQVSLENLTLIRDSADSTGGDQSSFYGVGAAALVTNGSLTISGSKITTDASGGAGVFAYGQGTAQVWDTEIHTSKNTSGGIHVAGGGTLHAWDLTVETQGESSAAIRSDRGSGTMVVDGGSYTSNGNGSPAVYSTADITVHNAQLTATGSEAICIEGLNTIRLYDCDLKGNMADLSQNDCTWNVILYQSMSGDSEIGNSTFEMVGGSLTAGNGGMFYTTNTESTFLLSQVEITYAQENDFFLRCTGNANQRGWGSSGNNGANCRFLASQQEMEGNVIWDRISQLELTMTKGSTLRGAVLREETYGQGKGCAVLSIDESSTWIVTADSYVSRLHAKGQIVDGEGKPVTVMGEDGTVLVQGSGSVTVYVESYDTVLPENDLQFHTWDNFAVQKPTVG